VKKIEKRFGLEQRLLVHQLRNPLTALRTFGQLLLRRLEPDSRHRPLVESLLAEQTQMNRYIDAIGSLATDHGSGSQLEAARSSPLLLPPSPLRQRRRVRTRAGSAAAATPGDDAYISAAGEATEATSSTAPLGSASASSNAALADADARAREKKESWIWALVCLFVASPE
jgi:hypothetical protein